MNTNDAAERTRERLGVFYREPIERPLYESASRDLDKALAAERQIGWDAAFKESHDLTVERIRAEVGPVNDAPEEWNAQDERRRTHAILDAEAER